MAVKALFIDWFMNHRATPKRDCADFTKAGDGDMVFQEQFKTLRSKIEYKLDAMGWKVIGITSSIAGEGKTLTCAKAAESLALTKRKKVLLVDADIRKADLSKGLFKSKSPGLTEILSGNTNLQQVIRQTGVPGLEAISAGEGVAQPADLLAGARFRSLIDALRKEFDIIILDTPPVLAVSDTISMKEHLDGFVFIYRAGFTPMSMFQQATEEIGEKKILGVVLNGVERQPEKYYSHYYGSYYIDSKKIENAKKASR